MYNTCTSQHLATGVETKKKEKKKRTVSTRLSQQIPQPACYVLPFALSIFFILFAFFVGVDVTFFNPVRPRISLLHWAQRLANYHQRTLDGATLPAGTRNNKIRGFFRGSTRQTRKGLESKVLGTSAS
jgi:hypothetical protein